MATPLKEVDSILRAHARVYRWALWLIAATMQAQVVGFGLKAGVPLTGALAASSGYHAHTGHYTFGPTFELHLPMRFSLAADLLYKRLEYGTAESSRWEVPVMAKYRFTRFFAGAGAAFNRVTGDDAGLAEAPLRHRGTYGVVAAGGVETRLGRLRIAPELRFTHWADRNFGVRDTPVRSNLNQWELLAGFTF